MVVMKELLRKIADMQELAPEDSLTEELIQYQETELDESSLDCVFAASGQAYQEFLKLAGTRIEEEMKK